jgi:hypothetical protein
MRDAHAEACVVRISATKPLILLLLTGLREVIRSFQTVCKDFSCAFAATCSRSKHSVHLERSPYGEADNNHSRNPLSVDLARPQCKARMVSPMRSRSGNDRDGRHRSDHEPGTVRIRRMAQFRGAAPAARSRWLSGDLPEFTASTCAEHKNQLTAVRAVA